MTMLLWADRTATTSNQGEEMTGPRIENPEASYSDARNRLTTTSRRMDPITVLWMWRIIWVSEFYCRSSAMVNDFEQEIQLAIKENLSKLLEKDQASILF